MKIEEAIEKLKAEKKRKFNQTYDLIINLKNIDLKNPENRITKEIVLPHGRGKDVNVCVISDRFGVTKKEIEELAKSKKELKKFAKKYDFFLADASLMMFIGKEIGKYLSPAGKMPQPIPPNFTKEQIDEIMKKKKNVVKIKLKTTPVIQLQTGVESMEPEKIKENVDAIIKDVIAALPKARAQIKSVLLKLTMSKPVRIDF